jgi:hypothetical protein
MKPGSKESKEKRHQMNEQPAAEAEHHTEWAVQAILEEYKFCCSLISLYRGFQMQALGFSIVLYAAVLALVGATMETDYVGQVAAYSTAFLSYPIAFLIAAFGVMEIRIVRASRYIQFTIYERLRHYLGLPEDSPLLEYEKDPGKHLNTIQREMSSSAFFIVIMALPAVIAAIWNMLFSTVAGRNLVYVASLGLGLLLIMSITTIYYSTKHEAR